ncbi:hypothetical protein CA830_00365 [Burkholderia multivorans]|nr:hypothetical protein CA830_00365 [Burkholderia multivorans]
MAAQLDGTVAQAEALDVWHRYRAYRDALAKLPDAGAVTDKSDLGALQLALDRRASIAYRTLGDWSEPFFGAEQWRQRYDLARLRIMQDRTLTDAQKAERLAALDQQMPADERAWLEATLRDTAPREHLSHGAALRRAFGDRNVWALAAFWLLQAFGTIGLTLFLPLLVKSLSGQSSFAVGSLSALPFLFACVAMYANGRHSDLGGERALHLGVPMLLAGALLVGAIYVHVLPVAYALLVLAVGFNWAATPVFWAVATEYVSGLTAAASIALINAVANIAGLALPPVMGRIKDVTHSYDLALLLVAVALLVGGVLGLRIASRRRAMPMAARRAG